MYRAEFKPLVGSDGVFVTRLAHSGPLPPPWLAPGFVVNLVVEGRADLAARGSTHSVAPGSVVLADAGELRALRRRHTPRAVTRSLTFTEDRLRRALEDRALGNRPLHFRANVSSGLTLPLRRLYSAVDDHDSRLAIDSALERVLDAVVVETGLRRRRGPPRNPAIRRAEALIRERFREEITLEDLAREVKTPHASLRATGRRTAGRLCPGGRAMTLISYKTSRAESSYHRRYGTSLRLPGSARR